MTTFSVRYVFDMVVKNLSSLQGAGASARKMAGDMMVAGSAADKMAGSAARVAAGLANQTAAAQNAGRALAGYANHAQNAAYRAEQLQRVAEKNAAWMAKGYTRGPDGHWIAPAAGKATPGGGLAQEGAGLAFGAFLSYFTGWGRKLFDTNLQFEKEFNNARAVMAKSSPEELLKMRQQVMGLASNSVFGPTAIMRAAGELGSAGYEANSVMNALPTALKMAQSGREPIDKMAEMMVAIRNQFGLDDTAANNEHVGNVLAETARQTMAKFSDLREAFKMAGPFAKMAGVDLETTAALLGALSQQGIKGSLGGTGLRRLETGFLKADKKSIGFLKKYGIDPRSVYDSKGKMKDIIGTIEMLEKKGIKASDAMRVFGDRAGPILGALLNEGSAALKKYRDSFRNSAGSLDKMTGEQMQGLPGAWNRFTAAIESARLKIGQSGFTSDMERLVNLGTRLTRAFSDSPQWMQRMVGGAGVLAGALAALAMPVALLAFSLRTLGVTAALSSMAGFAAAMWRAAGAARLLLGMTGLGAALFIGYEVWQNWDKLAAAMERVKNAALGLTKGDLTGTKSIFQDIMGFLAGEKNKDGSYDWGLLGKFLGGAKDFFLGSPAKAEGLRGPGGAMSSPFQQLPLAVTANVNATFAPATINVQGTVDASGLVRLQGQGQIQANQSGRGQSAPEVGPSLGRGGGSIAPSGVE